MCHPAFPACSLSPDDRARVPGPRPSTNDIREIVFVPPGPISLEPAGYYGSDTAKAGSVVSSFTKGTLLELEIFF